MKVLNLYSSVTGNTKKIALRIEDTIKSQGFKVTTIEVNRVMDNDACDFISYDFVFIGSGVYSCLPPQAMIDFHKIMQKKYGGSGDIKSCAPRRSGKKAVVYCTFGGPHTGVNEAIPTVKYLGQLPDHLGFEIVAEWFFEGQFNSGDSFITRLNTEGRMGDITGRPNEEDLKRVANMVNGIIKV